MHALLEKSDDVYTDCSRAWCFSIFALYPAAGCSLQPACTYHTLRDKTSFSNIMLEGLEDAKMELVSFHFLSFLFPFQRFVLLFLGAPWGSRVI
jgi:hypothetical protein